MWLGNMKFREKQIQRRKCVGSHVIIRFFLYELDGILSLENIGSLMLLIYEFT